MKLRQKTLVIVSMTLTGLIGVLYFASSTILMGSIRSSEENEARQTVKGVQNLLAQSQKNFSDRFADWSAWDDTYKFIQDRNQEYITTNLIPKQLTILKVNYMVYVNTAGERIYSTGYDEKNKTGLSIPQELSSRILNKNDLLLTTTKQTGIMLLPTGMMWVTSQPILTSDATGPVRGSLIIGRRIDQNTIDELSQLARLKLKIYRFNDPQLPNSIESIRTALSQSQNLTVEPLSEETLAGYLLINDIDGKPGFILQVDIPRTTYKQGKANLKYLIVSLIFAGLVFDAVVIFLLERWILSRLSLLVSGVNRVRDTNDLALRLSIDGQDEMSNLTANINNMLDALAHSDDQQKQTLGQLADANSKIQTLNKELKSENVRMGTELEITRQLQQKILPKPKELEQIPDLDIAGFMEPASEVGGDYYDIIQTDGKVIISIGDVTGHGLESAILMIMVQTAIRTLLVSNITNYSLFLNLLNQVIFENVQRMNSDKTLTLALLDCDKGKITLSGQHEEMIVVRADGQVERINTVDLGFPIGLEPDIQDFIAQREVQLFAGDGVVLYTDGLTEAENEGEQPYGIERLCDLLQHNWHHTARSIQETIIKDLRNYIGKEVLHDDVTLLVIKQK
ncbi:MAG: SpoIIE family protein phosphatase [Cyanomargarita calcarea GSE-NOS-MK-12-04C]|jgi:sigma-B regulation protein RsbU (phosphoserine phosphatase)|uniref:SpoIIE family protein phosphatase n=1 Tax=Cyanomargarita calcarea GSE-NOS-MK-12-04C TaxID=2839659 RepID=A0A951QK78_9CYAN|nr:SpoIIE family protein phosphatase [Cyanomargarita calcarea GSE-NOS-MK-12-04C]